ncbi:MAG: AI-2E family transporter [Lentisphaeria bacterium]|nr:AI-2E family transporter [Lentisphaeria bacterium]
MEDKKENSGFFSKFLHHGGTGIIASIVIILIFLMCATWLRSLVFGMFLAVILLPLERFFQDKVFRKEKKGWFTRLKEKFSQKRLPEEEEKKKLKQQRIFKSSLAALFSFFAILLAVVLLAVAVLTPQAGNLRRSIVSLGNRSSFVTKVETYLMGKQNKNIKARTGEVSKIRASLKKTAEENKDKLAAFAMSHGQDILSTVFQLLKGLGTLLLDITLAVFFGFYFLQKAALFEGEGKNRRSRFGEWFVDMFFKSSWLPDVSRKTKWQTIRIITHIGGILARWIRGYFMVIVIEFTIYTLLFTAGGIPYPLLAGSVAGLSVLLPFIGPVVSFSLTVGLCIAFCDTGLFMTLIFVCVIYLLINGLLEQFFLYPTLIGEVSGLTTVETIIVVLIGGIIAGISGMIFAVPAAAIIKYIIPEIYRASSLNAGKEIETNTEKG